MTSKTMPMASGSATLDQARPVTQERVAFIDNIRILLVVVLIVFHQAIAYGGEGPWRYQEGGADSITTVVLTLFVTINQAFFMGFYFLIAAYFVPRSLERKGSFQFLKERLLRLGVPLAFYLLFVSPLISYGLGITIWGYHGSFWGYVGDYWRRYEQLDVGPLWFVEALLIFSIVVTFLIALAPVLFVVGGALEGNTEPFRGGLSWQNLVYALWEQFLCVAMVISLLVWFRQRRDQQGKLARTMSSNAYAVYVFHAPILLFVSIGLRSVELYPLLKFALAAAICVPLCFLAGGLVRKLPVARRIF